MSCTERSHQLPLKMKPQAKGTHQLLVRNADLDRLSRRAVLQVPVLHERHILRAYRPSTTLVVRMGRPPERNRVRRAIRLDLALLQEGLDGRRKLETVLVAVVAEDERFVRDEFVLGRDAARGDGVDDGVKVEGGEVGVLGADVEGVRSVVNGDVDGAREGVVEVGEGDLVLGADLLPDHDLVDVVELVPVVVVVVRVAVEGLEARSTGDGDVERFGGEEGLGLEEVEVLRRQDRVSSRLRFLREREGRTLRSAKSESKVLPKR